MTRKQERKGRGLSRVPVDLFHPTLYAVRCTLSLFAGCHAGGRRGGGPGQVPPFLLSPDPHPSCWPARRAFVHTEAAAWNWEP